MPGCLIISSTLDPYLEDEEDRNYNLMIKRAFTAKGVSRLCQPGRNDKNSFQFIQIRARPETGVNHSRIAAFTAIATSRKGWFLNIVWYAKKGE